MRGRGRRISGDRREMGQVASSSYQGMGGKVAD